MTETILRINKRNFVEEQLPHQLFLTTKQTTKIRNAFANNMSKDIRISKGQIFKSNHLGGSFDSWLANSRKKGTKKCCYSFS